MLEDRGGREVAFGRRGGRGMQHPRHMACASDKAVDCAQLEHARRLAAEREDSLRKRVQELEAMWIKQIKTAVTTRQGEMQAWRNESRSSNGTSKAQTACCTTRCSCLRLALAILSSLTIKHVQSTYGETRQEIRNWSSSCSERDNLRLERESLHRKARDLQEKLAALLNCCGDKRPSLVPKERESLKDYAGKRREQVA